MTIENVSQVAVVNTASLAIVDRVPVGPGPRGIAVDPQSMTMYVAAFSRLGAGGIVGDPPADGTVTADNTVTVVELQPTLTSLAAGGHPGKVRTEHVKVGMGPCAVAILDTTRLRLGGAKKDHQSGKKPDCLLLAFEAENGDGPLLIAEARCRYGTRLFWMQPYTITGTHVEWGEPASGGWNDPGGEEMILDAAFSGARTVAAVHSEA